MLAIATYLQELISHNSLAIVKYHSVLYLTLTDLASYIKLDINNDIFMLE